MHFRRISIIEAEQVAIFLQLCYNAVGLIGGELFMGQQGDRTTQDKFQTLIKKIKSFLDQDKMKEVWLTSNLMTGNIGPLTETLDILMKKTI